MTKKNTSTQKMPEILMASNTTCLQIFMWPMVLILLITQFACTLSSAPVRTPQTTTGFVEVFEFPEIIKRGESGTFVIETFQDSICLGTIFYTDLNNDKLVQVDLSNLRAGADGKCRWTWQVPANAKTGIATFRAAVDQAGLHGFISPQTFCIDICPWGNP